MISYRQFMRIDEAETVDVGILNDLNKKIDDLFAGLKSDINDIMAKRQALPQTPASNYGARFKSVAKPVVSTVKDMYGNAKDMYGNAKDKVYNWTKSFGGKVADKFNSWKKDNFYKPDDHADFYSRLEGVSLHDYKRFNQLVDEFYEELEAKFYQLNEANAADEIAAVIDRFKDVAKRELEYAVSRIPAVIQARTTPAKPFEPPAGKGTVSLRVKNPNRAAPGSKAAYAPSVPPDVNAAYEKEQEREKEKEQEKTYGLADEPQRVSPSMKDLDYLLKNHKGNVKPKRPAANKLRQNGESLFKMFQQNKDAGLDKSQPESESDDDWRDTSKASWKAAANPKFSPDAEDDDMKSGDDRVPPSKSIGPNDFPPRFKSKTEPADIAQSQEPTMKKKTNAKEPKADASDSDSFLYEPTKKEDRNDYKIELYKYGLISMFINHGLSEEDAQKKAEIRIEKYKNGTIPWPEYMNYDIDQGRKFLAKKHTAHQSSDEPAQEPPTGDEERQRLIDMYSGGNKAELRRLIGLKGKHLKDDNYLAYIDKYLADKRGTATQQKLEHYRQLLRGSNRPISLIREAAKAESLSDRVDFYKLRLRG